MKINHSKFILKTFWLYSVILIYLNGLISYSQVNLPIKIKDSLVKTHSGKIETKLIKLSGNDGPYIINDSICRVTAGNKLIAKIYAINDSLVIRVDNVTEDKFYLTLQSNYDIPESNYEASNEFPMLMYYSDFDNDAEADTIIATEKNKVCYPIEGLFSFKPFDSKLQVAPINTFLEVNTNSGKVCCSKEITKKLHHFMES